MTFIKKILDTEEEARTMIATAGDEAKTSVHNEQEAQKKAVVDALSELKEDRTKQIVDQKGPLTELYKEGLAKGQKDVARIQKKVGVNHEAAVSEVLNSLTS